MLVKEWVDLYQSWSISEILQAKNVFFILRKAKYCQTVFCNIFAGQKNFIIENMCHFTHDRIDSLIDKRKVHLNLAKTIDCKHCVHSA